MVFEKTYGIIVGAGVSRRIVGRSGALNLKEIRRRSVMLQFDMHNLVNSLCFLYLLVLNESMSLLCVFV